MKWDVARAEYADTMQAERLRRGGPKPKAVTTPRPGATADAKREAGGGLQANTGAAVATNQNDEEVLYARILANCCEFSGLTPSQLTKHARNIANVCKAARATPHRRTDVEFVTYLGAALLVRSDRVEVYDQDTGEFAVSFQSMRMARQFVRSAHANGRAVSA